MSKVSVHYTQRVNSTVGFLANSVHLFRVRKVTRHWYRLRDTINIFFAPSISVYTFLVSGFIELYYLFLFPDFKEVNNLC